MKKIGILTHYYQSKNIGGLLQAYALPCILNKYSYNTEQISFDLHIYKTPAERKKCNELFYNNNSNITLKKIIKYPFSKIKYFILENLNSYKHNIYLSKKIDLQNNIFNEFENVILHSQQVYTISNILETNKNYDIFIIGSDQVFATYLFCLSVYYGEFATKDKKVIAYGASSNVKQFPPKAEKLFIQKLQRFNAISVRERTLKGYIESITDKKVAIVLDPTFLLSKEEWLKISNPKILPNKKYIFCYFLGNKASWQRKIAQVYADKYGYEVIHLPYIMRTIRSADKYLKGQGRYDVGPREFISLINNAECIFTDSFHGMAFSINFNKNFYVFNRDDKTGSFSMNARITDTLDMLGLSSRYITSEKAILYNNIIDYTKANKILKEEKEKSINWLLNALKN